MTDPATVARAFHHSSRQADPQRGSMMVLVMMMLAVLLAAGAATLYLQMSSTRSAGMSAWIRRSLYCAESGLVVAGPLVGSDYPVWDTLLDGDDGNDPRWYPVVGDIDGDGRDDFEVTVRDNDDEFPPLANDPSRDNDMQLILISRCTINDQTPQTVMQLVTYTGGGGIHRHMLGFGPSATGNEN